MTPSTPTPTVELAFPFLRANERPPKPRARGVTEIRGPYYSVMGPRYLKDVLDTMGEHVDALKFAGGSFTLMPEPALREIIEIAHEHDVLVFAPSSGFAPSRARFRISRWRSSS
jgi:phosphosulfolactate synthase (CoM biosynthesis protein A)